MTHSSQPPNVATRPEGALPSGRLLRLLGSAEEAICYTLLGALVVTTSLQVFTRYVLNAPLTWTEELARMFFTWINFLGAALIVKRSSHISIDFATNLLPPGPRRWVLALAHVITLVILSILAVKGFQFLRTTGISASPALGVPWVYVYLAFPIGMSLMVVRYGHSLVLLFRPSTPRSSGLVDRPESSEGPQRPGGMQR